MAHVVKYWTNGEIHFAPTVTRPVKAKAHTSPADVMLVSALLNMRYSGPRARHLPPGALHVIKPSGTYSAQTHLFIMDFQRSSSLLRPDGNVSPLPIGHTDDQLFPYTIFALYHDVWTLAADQGDANAEDTVLQSLKSLPHLHNLDAAIAELPPAGSESRAGSGIVTVP
jgi:hypothetical protein